MVGFFAACKDVDVVAPADTDSRRISIAVETVKIDGAKWLLRAVT